MSQASPYLSKRPLPKVLSLVIPAFNEEESLPHLRRSIETWRRTLNCELQVVIVNDGSSDATFPLLIDWAKGDKSVTMLSLSTNFGHQAAVTAGLRAAVGDVIVIIDADLQDPLEAIAPMIAKYQEGYDVVYGRRLSRAGETWFKRFTAWLFYRLMRTLVHPRLPVDTGDFRLVSRRCLDAVLSMNETHRFLRGMFTWVGFPQTAVEYHRNAREFGSTKYPLHRMLKLAWNAALSFSTTPITLISTAGIIASAGGVLYALYSVWSHFFAGNTVPGWTTLVVLMCLIWGSILIALGVLGQYIGRIYEETKNRPLYIVAESLNLPGDLPSGSVAKRGSPGEIGAASIVSGGDIEGQGDSPTD